VEDVYKDTWRDSPTDQSRRTKLGPSIRIIRPVNGHGPSTAPLAHPSYIAQLDTHGQRKKNHGRRRRVCYRRHAVPR
jgi:hypothetical protein